jgi:hypothetical protein
MATLLHDASHSGQREAAARPTCMVADDIVPAAATAECTRQVADYEADPLVYRGNTAVSTAYQMGCAVFALRDTRHQLELPLYALHCTDDHITPYQVRHPARLHTWLALLAAAGYSSLHPCLCKAAMQHTTTCCRHPGQASAV